MPNRMNHNQLFVMDQLVDHTVVTYAQLEQTVKLSCECFESNILKILCQPMHSLNDSPSHRLIQSGQIL